MIERRIGLPVLGIKNTNLGDNLDVTEDEVGVEDVTLTPVFPNAGDTNSTNDNYLLGPTLANNLVQSKRVVQRTFQTVKLKLVDSSVRKLVKTQSTASLNCQNVSCLAVNRVLSVCSHGLPQKKGISPFVKKTEIKDVKMFSV